MKTITIERENRTLTFNPLFVKEVELVHNTTNDDWCVNVIHIINDREVSEPIVFAEETEARRVYVEYKSCLESI